MKVHGLSCFLSSLILSVAAVACPQSPVGRAEQTSTPGAADQACQKSQYLVESKQYARAMDCFEALLEAKPEDRVAAAGEVQAATQLAIEERRAAHPEAALGVLARARQAVPGDPTLLLDFGIQAQQMGLRKDANDALVQALALRPRDADTLYALARVEMDSDNLHDAELHLRTYLEQAPQDASAHYGLGRLLYQGLRVDEAKSEFSRSIELQPLQTESYYELGRIALDLRQDNEAAAYFAKTLARDPKHGGALTGSGMIAYRTKSFEQAEALLRQAVASAPNYQPAHYYLGLTLKRLGKTSEAEAELKSAVSLAHSQQMNRLTPPQLADALTKPVHQ